jgi:ubiquinone/menaquinone biosynthesis C-methylase UbiE
MSLFEKHNLAKYISGRGVEIGALDNPLKVKLGSTHILYMDMTDRDGLIKQNPETAPEKITQPDLIASAEDPIPIETGSMDFVIACHMLEHLPNPLKALKEIYRVLKPGGILYLSVPDKRYTFDSERQVTPLSHVQKDYEEEATVDTCVDHYKEWVDFVESRKKKPIVKTVNEAKQYRIHFHVWVPDSIPEMFKFMAKNLDSPFSLTDYYYSLQLCSCVRW